MTRPDAVPRGVVLDVLDVIERYGYTLTDSQRGRVVLHLWQVLSGPHEPGGADDAA